MKAQDDEQIHRGVEPIGAGKTSGESCSGPPTWPSLGAPARWSTQQTVAVGQWRQSALREKRTRAAVPTVLAVIVVIAVVGGPLLALGGRGLGSVGPLSHAGPVVQRPTWTPLPTATPTLVPLPDFSMPPFCSVPDGTTPPLDCVQCPYTFDQTTYSRTQIREALDDAADQYQLPRALVYAIAWGESNWHSGFITCNYDLGVMQLKLGYLATFDIFDEPAAWCPGVTRTLYDPIRSMRENVLLGAKLLAWLRCYYGWMASSGGSRTAPDRDTLAWYYQQAGTPLPDTASAQSLCQAAAQYPTKPWFKDLGAQATDLWSCPFSAKAGDRTFLDLVIAAYNGGPQALDGSIPNDGYVSYIEGIMTQFAQGQLPPP
jgi:hypothetical protein